MCIRHNYFNDRVFTYAVKSYAILLWPNFNLLMVATTNLFHTTHICAPCLPQLRHASFLHAYFWMKPNYFESRKIRIYMVFRLCVYVRASLMLPFHQRQSHNIDKQTTKKNISNKVGSI